MNRKVHALILAAGKGTRMKEDNPKVLTPIFGKPFISYVIDALTGAGVDKIYPIVGHQASMIEEVLGPMDYVHQTELLGTGHAVQQAASFLEGKEGTTLVMAGDQPLITPQSIQRLLEVHHHQHNALTLLTAQNPHPFGYGRILRDGDQVIGMVEESDATDAQKLITEVNISTYCFDNKILFQSIQQLTNNNHKQEYYINDLVGILHREGHRVQAIPSTNLVESIGINDKQTLEEATNLMKLSINEHWMQEGVTIIDKNNTYIGPDVTIGAGTIIYPGSVLEGHVVIGKDCVIETSYIRDAVIGDDTTVGPFAHIRHDSVIGDHVRVGNFVEIKKSKLAQGVKSAHLTYLGDSEIGEKTNIGCGTITVNYDGKNKHKTIVGKNSFIGSNVNLIAPLRVGDNSTIAAGSTINKDVPSNSLAIAREHQITKVGYYLDEKGKK